MKTRTLSFSITLGCAALAVATLAACDQTPQRKAIVLAPSTRQSAPVVAVAATPATTQSATTQTAPKVSRMLINGVWFEFPEARLIVRKEGEKLTAFLCSNDPPEVINPTYQGNRFYFELALDTIDDIKNIAQADFRYKAPSAEAQDTPNGVFIDGDRQHFQPYNIQVVFDHDGANIVADIRGEFLYFTKGNLVGQMVPIAAQISAKPQSK